MDESVDRWRQLQLGPSIGIAMLLASACFLSYLATPPAPGPRRPRVLLVGIDGASPKVLDTMFAAGRMKNLRAIAKDGAYGPLKSEAQLLSPRVWTTIATGKVPARHGIEGWVKMGYDGKAYLFYGSDRRGWALWNILSETGKSVAVVNWLITYPPEVVNGVMVTDHALAKEVERKKSLGGVFAKARRAELTQVQSPVTGVGAVYPAQWTQRALAPAHTKAVLTTLPSPFRRDSPDNGFRRFSHSLQDFWDVDQQLASITLEILDAKNPDVTMVLFQGIDRVSHYLFGCLESPVKYPSSFKPSVEQRLNCQRALYDYYEFTDQLIGQLLKRFDTDDLVMVVSDHGFEAGFNEYRTGDHTSVDASYGVCLARGPRILVNGTVVGTNVLDITPTVLDWYGLPSGMNMDGKPAAFLEPLTPEVKRILTYDTRPVERLGEGASGGEANVKDQLRSLGYLQ